MTWTRRSGGAIQGSRRGASIGRRGRTLSRGPVESWKAIAVSRYVCHSGLFHQTVGGERKRGVVALTGIGYLLDDTDRSVHWQNDCLSIIRLHVFHFIERAL